MRVVVLASLLALAAPVMAVNISPATQAEQAGMLEIRTLAPDIAMDIRYASDNNFSGRVVPGYDAPKCYLLRPVAEALAKVQHSLRSQGYSLQIFDCYRPAHSVTAFVHWAQDLSDQGTKSQYYPNVEKHNLLGGYIAETSGHSRGATVDLSVLDCRSGNCTILDMGTDFDFFDPRAHTASEEVSPAQREHRQLLLREMQAQGFSNYPMEWWHFTWTPEPDPETAFDFPLR